MIRQIQDFVDIWTEEASSTVKLLGNLTDEALSTRINPEGRTMRRLVQHITESIGEMLHRAGLVLDAAAEDLSSDKSVNELQSDYASAAAAVLEAVRTQWSDASLTETVDMYGQQWTKGMVLHVLMMHQAHHRGQLTVLMRQSGLMVPGVCGPSREEWVSMGLPAMA